MHLAPTASRRVYQQRIGRIMRMHPRKEAGIVVDFVNKGATHNDRVISLHSLLGADFYREGARVTPAPRRRPNRRARRKLSPAPWLVPVTPDVRRRLAVIQREWQRIDPRYLDEDEQRYWASIAGRQVRFEERADFVKKLSDGKASKACLEQFLATAAAENPNRRLRMMALSDRVSMTVERADFDDLVTLVIQGATWEKDRIQGARILLRAIGEGKADAPEQILDRWTWKLARVDAQGAGPARERRVPGGEAAPGRARQLARPPARGERGEARERGARAAARSRRRPARLGGRLHAARDEADRRRPREDRHALRGRVRARGEPPAAEGAHGPPQASATQAEGRPAAEPAGGEAQAAQPERKDGDAPKRRRRRRKPAHAAKRRARADRDRSPPRAAEASNFR